MQDRTGQQNIDILSTGDTFAPKSFAHLSEHQHSQTQLFNFMFWRIRIPRDLPENEIQSYLEVQYRRVAQWCYDMARENPTDADSVPIEFALTMLKRPADLQDRFSGDNAYNGYLELCRMIATMDRWRTWLEQSAVDWIDTVFAPANEALIQSYRVTSEKG